MKKILALSLSLLMLFSLCACGAKSAPRDSAAYAPALYSAQESEYAAESAAWDAGGLAAANGAAAARGAENSSSAEEVPEERADKIIYSSDVTVETTDFDATLGNIDALIARFDGWIESSSVNGANYYDLSRGRSSTRSASFTLRIPGERFDELMGSLSELGNVPYTHVYTENVTAQYYDTQAHRNAYLVQEARLLEMMESAESVEDIILLEDRLTELRWQIESLESSLLNWDRRVSFSTVYLQLNEVREYTPDTPAQLGYGERLARAFRSGLTGVGHFFQNFLLWFVEALPTLVLLAVLLLVLFPLGKKLCRRVKERRASRKAAKAEKKKNERPTATPL